MDPPCGSILSRIMGSGRLVTKKIDVQIGRDLHENLENQPDLGTVFSLVRSIDHDDHALRHCAFHLFQGLCHELRELQFHIMRGSCSKTLHMADQKAGA